MKTYYDTKDMEFKLSSAKLLEFTQQAHVLQTSK